MLEDFLEFDDSNFCRIKLGENLNLIEKLLNDNGYVQSTMPRNYKNSEFSYIRINKKI